jgi:phage/plasmid-like protein (TIGR03299 family)
VAHNIANIGGVDQFAYAVREGVRLPWHGLGQPHEGLMVVGEALELSGVGALKVNKRETMIDGHGTGCYGMVANGSPLQGVSVGPNYGVVQYDELLTGLVEAAFGTGAKVVDTMGLLGQGERMICTFLGDLAEILPGDAVQSYMISTSSHDGTGAVLWFGSETRVVCQNTLRIALAGAKNMASIRHTKNAQVSVAEALAALKVVREARDARIAAFKALGERQLSVAEFKAFLDALHPIEAGETKGKTVGTRNRLTSLFEGQGVGADLAGRTAWGAFQAVTQSADEGARGDQPWLTSLLNSTQNAYRQTAFDLLLKV